MCSKLHLTHFIINHGGSSEQGTQASIVTVLSYKESVFLYKWRDELDICANYKEPHWKHKREYLSMSFINLSDDMSMIMTVFSYFCDVMSLSVPVMMSS